MLTKDACVQKYKECKRSKKGGIPGSLEFLKYAGIDKRKLSRLFGPSAYSKLQDEAGDNPNRLQMERTPYATIMQRYGDLVMDVGAVPPYAEWDMRGLKPTEAGLRSKPHNMKWSDLPTKFVEWVRTNSISGFENALEIIAKSSRAAANTPKDGDRDFSRLINNVRSWTPARRRNSEGEYKIELRKHLESLDYKLNEEYGESQFDLLVEKEYTIELKKDPDLAEYDRLFGQVARHLQHSQKVIVLIIAATRKDKYDNFVVLVDKYLNVGQDLVDVIKR
jgi:hypothetical protein